MREEYTKELKELKEKMEMAEIFAKNMGYFSDEILREKRTGLEDWVRYAERYKSLPLAWGLNRGHFISGTPRNITNYSKDHNVFCWNVYINTLTLYSSHAKYGLNKIENNIDIYFYDRLNTTFYFTDEQFITVMDVLHDWFLKAMAQNKEESKGERLRRLEEEKKKLEDKIKEIT